MARNLLFREGPRLIRSQLDENQKEHAEDASRDDSILSSKIERDPDLAFEEEHSQLKTEHIALKKKHADFISRFEELQIKNDDLHQRNDTIEQKLIKFEQASSNDQAEYIIKDLRKTIDELESIIERHENESELNRVTKEQLSRENNSLRRSAERAVELDDEVKMLRNDNSTLVKKANMVDHFQRKLELQSGMEKDNIKLREQIDVLQENQKDYDQVHADIEKHQRTAKENKQTLEHYENQLLDSQHQNKTLKEELRKCDIRIDELHSKGLRDEEFIRDLQEQLKIGVEIPFSPTTPIAGGRPGVLSLEQELEQSEDPSHILRLENARLKTEIQVLRSGMSGTTNAELRSELAESERVRKRYEENLEMLTVKHAIGEEQLSALQSSSPTEK